MFIELARETLGDSLDEAGWDWGYRSRDELIEPIAKVAFDIPAGSYSLPIKSELGYHIIKIVEKAKAGELKPLALVQDDIRLKMEAGLQHDNYERFLLQTKSKFTVRTNFELLNAKTNGTVARGDVAREGH